MHQIIHWIRIKVCQLKNWSSTSVALVTQFVGFSGLHMEDKLTNNQFVILRFGIHSEQAIYQGWLTCVLTGI